MFKNIELHSVWNLFTLYTLNKLSLFFFHLVSLNLVAEYLNIKWVVGRTG